MQEYQPSIGGIEDPNTPYDNFYSKVMSPRDVINNILRNLKDPNVSGITFKFSKENLVLTVNDYADPSDQVLKDMIGVANEAIKYLKKHYKAVTGKTLKLKQIANAYDVVGAYTTNKKAKIAYQLIFDISGNKDESEVNSLDKENKYDDNRKPDFKVA